MVTVRGQKNIALYLPDIKYYTVFVFYFLEMSNKNIELYLIL